MAQNFFSKKSESEPEHQAEQFVLEQEIARDQEKITSVEFVEKEENTYEIKNIKWPTIGEFNETVGAQKIEEFIKNVSFYRVFI